MSFFDKFKPSITIIEGIDLFDYFDSNIEDSKVNDFYNGIEKINKKYESIFDGFIFEYIGVIHVKTICKNINLLPDNEIKLLSIEEKEQMVQEFNSLLNTNFTIKDVKLYILKN